ncbi:TrsE protein [Paenibacillus pasadenensis]|uniref:TrsE protein n=1 Tax=Paenibacillus pasadenensis TaxID=217090 RepID=A0A2N5MZP1_9BACL|nr:hypothetical protein [Paenibacillus pasadenensis]PLT43553.1 TrsE protein [Paenibacillus pasadenensis]
MALRDWIPHQLRPGGTKTPVQALPFKRFDEDYLQLTDGTYRCVLKVSPINNDLLEDDENDQVVEAMQEAINSTAVGIMQFTVSSERLNLDEYMAYLQQKIDGATEEYFMLRLQSQLEYTKRQTEKQRNVKSYYFTLTSRNSDLKRAREDFDETMRKVDESLGRSEMFIKKMTKSETLRMLYEKLNPITSVSQPFRPEQESLESIAPEPIRHSEYYSEMDGMYYRFFTIVDYPEKTYPAWMKKVFDANAEVDVSFLLQQTGKQKMITNIDNSIGFIRWRLNKPGTRQSEIIELEAKEKSSRQLLTDLSSDAEQVYNMTAFITVRERSLKALEVACERVQLAVSTSKMSARQVILMNNDMFWLSLPIAYPSALLQNENYYWPMQSSVIGSILPFNSSDFQMKSGVIMGRNPDTNSLIICDRRDKKRVDNPNKVVIAPSGRGKTWNIKSDVIRETSHGVKGIIIDPDREYRFKFGERVVFSIGSDFCTNPFHIRSAILDIDEDEEGNDSNNYTENVGAYLQRKIGDLIPFFRQIYPTMNSTEEASLMGAIQAMYEESGLTFQSTTLPNEFPTITSLYQVISRPEFLVSLSTFATNLQPYVDGIYKKMFNGQTNWSMDSQLTVLDINSLSPVIQPQMMYLLLADIWEYIKKDRNELVGLYIDEAWKLADPDNPQTLKFLFELSKRVRKYGGSLTTITQSVEDFFAAGSGSKNYGKHIFDNAFFKVFLGLSEDDYRALTAIGFRFSRREERILKRRNAKGSGIFIAGSTRVRIQSVPLLDEMQFIDTTLAKTYAHLPGGLDYSEVNEGA